METQTSSLQTRRDLAFDHQSGRTLRIEGAEIYFEEKGRPADHALVLLHGGLGTMEDFNGVLPVFAERHRVIGIDSRGHGKSTLGQTRLSYERLQHDIEVLVKSLSLRSLDLIGFSDGGIVGYRIAAAGKLPLRKFVALGARATLTANTPGYDFLRRVTAESWKKKFPETLAVYQTLNPSPDFDTLVTQAVDMWTDLSPGGYPGEDLLRTRVPMLLLRGAEDHLVSEADLAGLAQRLPHARFAQIPAAGHEAFKDQPTLFTSQVMDFLSAP